MRWLGRSSSHRNSTLPCTARGKLVNAYFQCVRMRMWLISACNVSRAGCGTVCSCRLCLLCVSSMVVTHALSREFLFRLLLSLIFGVHFKYNFLCVFYARVGSINQDVCVCMLYYVRPVMQQPRLCDRQVLIAGDLYVNVLSMQFNASNITLVFVYAT